MCLLEFVCIWSCEIKMLESIRMKLVRDSAVVKPNALQWLLAKYVKAVGVRWDALAKAAPAKRTGSAIFAIEAQAKLEKV